LGVLSARSFSGSQQPNRDANPESWGFERLKASCRTLCKAARCVC
jgi:hypothetical protein